MEISREAANKRNYLLAGVVSLALGIACIAGAYHYRSADTSDHFGAVDNQVLMEIPLEEVSGDLLYITLSRKQYTDGSMRLIIPAIALETEVGRSTEPDGLEEKPGLYEFSQLPDIGDVNVSIAGHRDIYGKEFYSMDKLSEGDSLYLVYENRIYRYQYLDEKVVRPDAWEVIKPQGFSCLTLTTCDPIGTTKYRLVIRAELADITDYSDDYSYIA